MNKVVRIDQLTKSFGAIRALSSVGLDISAGEMVALIGASGSGKSTLLRHIGGLAVADPNGGSIETLGQVTQKDGRLLSGGGGNRADIGFIFQQFNLVDRLSVLRNVLLGRLGRIGYWRGAVGHFTHEEKQRAMAALYRVGIADKALQRAGTLSGGQQQRAAIARTLVQEAKIILADEPIASLDPAASKRVMEILQQIQREDGATILVSLHQVDYAVKYCPRIVALKQGRVVFDGPREQVTVALLKRLYGDESEELMLPKFDTGAIVPPAPVAAPANRQAAPAAVG